MKNNLMTVALLTTGSAFAFAMAVAAPKLSKGLIPLGAALGGASVAVVLIGGEGETGDRAHHPAADRETYTPPSPAFSTPAIFGQPPIPTELMAGTLIFCGTQGSGKSTSAVMVLHDRVAHGARGIVLNHHAGHGQYEGLQAFGRGETFEDRFLSLESGMRLIIGEIEKRYHQLQSMPNPTFSPISILMEEMSSWRGNIDKDLLGKFIKLTLTDTRKAAIQTIWVTHNLTKECWGGVDGVASLVKSSGTIIYLDAIPDGNGGMKSSGYAEIEASGKKRKVKLAGYLPNISDNLWDFTRYGAPRQHQIRNLEAAFNLPTSEKTCHEVWERMLDILNDNSPAKVRDIQRHKHFRGMSADEIRVILTAMMADGIIVFDGNQAEIIASD